jgi:pimeloyl-ACP methyl ester carboxylesterase
MKPPDSAVVTVGDGADVVFIHGTGRDKRSWRAPIRMLGGHVRATAYDRRGTQAWPLAEDAPVPTVEVHAEDAADVIVGVGSDPVHLFAVSFGAVIALELMRVRADLVRSAVLFEPALARDEHASTLRRLCDEFEAQLSKGQPERAAEHFYRRALGEAAWHLLGLAAQKQAASNWMGIWCDLKANALYRLRDEDLAAIDVPILLLQGGLSRRVFDRTFVALRRNLPRCEYRLFEQVSHHPKGVQWRHLMGALAGFIG